MAKRGKFLSPSAPVPSDSCPRYCSGFFLAMRFGRFLSPLFTHFPIFLFSSSLFVCPPPRSRPKYKMSSQNRPGARAKAKAREEATAKAPPVPLSAPCGNPSQHPPDVDVARSRSPPTLGRSNEEVMAMGQCWDLGELGLKVPAPADRSSAAFITWARPKTAAHWRKPGSREAFA